MVDLSSIYRNPVIPEGYYYVKVIKVRTDQVPGCEKPRIQVEMRPWWKHELDDNLTLSAIVYPTDAARFFYENFCNTFLRPGEPVEKALNRWGCIEVLKAKYDKTEYSSVKWIKQIYRAKQVIAQILSEEHEERVDA